MTTFVIYLTSVSSSPWTVPSDWNSANNTIECTGSDAFDGVIGAIPIGRDRPRGRTHGGQINDEGGHQVLRAVIDTVALVTVVAELTLKPIMSCGASVVVHPVKDVFVAYCAELRVGS